MPDVTRIERTWWSPGDHPALNDARIIGRVTIHRTTGEPYDGLEIVDGDGVRRAVWWDRDTRYFVTQKL